MERKIWLKISFDVSLIFFKHDIDNNLLDSASTRNYMELSFNLMFNKLLIPIFKTTPQITTFALARSDANEHSLLRKPNNSIASKIKVIGSSS